MYLSATSSNNPLSRARAYIHAHARIAVCAACWLLAGLFAALIATTAAAATAPGTIILNQATVRTANSAALILSNVDRIEVAEPPPGRTPAKLTIWRQDEASGERSWIHPATSNGRLIPLPPALPVEPDGSALIGIRAARSFRSGEAIFIELADWDQNKDSNRSETVEIAIFSDKPADRERYVLTETGPNTGRFTAYVPTSVLAVSGDGALGVGPDMVFFVSYSDPADAADVVSVQAVIDPLGRVFDSATGRALNGVRITIVDAITGRPASVCGNDGVSAFPSTVVSGTTVRDASGTVYSLPPGGFTFPFVAPGSYRYEVSLPARAGYAFPSTVANATLQTLPGAPYRLAFASRGSPATIAQDPFVADLPLDPDATSLVLDKRALNPTAANGDHVAYELTIANQRSLAAFEDVVLEDRLPVGFRLDLKSVRLDGQRVEPVLSADGRTFKITLSPIAPGETANLRYLARVTAAPIGPATNHAIARFGTFTSNDASSTVVVRDELMATRAHILGRVVCAISGRPSTLGLQGVAVVLETGSMSVTDERGFFRFEGVQPGTHIVQLDKMTLPAGAQVIATDDAPQAQRRPWSRMVDVAAGSLWQVEFAVRLPESSPVAAQPTPPATANEVLPVVAYDRAWIQAEPVDAAWVLPRADDTPLMPVTNIVVKHPVAHRISATINGQPVPVVNFDGVLTRADHAFAASIWSSVNLREGDNEIVVVRTDSFGNERGRELRTIHFASPPVRAELAPAQSTLVANGVTQPVVAVRLFDRDGRPARNGVRGRFSVAEPYQALRDERLNLRLLPGALPQATEYLVGSDGVALLSLEPTTTSGRVRVILDLASGPTEVMADLRADRREWIVVGLADGTVAHRTVSGNIESAADAGVDSGWSEDGRVALYVKGRVRGNWLLTAAYDSAKTAVPNRALHGGIEPDAYYTVYGDQSDRHENAASRGKLFVKLERDIATLLLGDFSLDWSSSSFTTYTRSLHGAMVEVRAGGMRVSVFQSDAGLSAVRDELPGTGLSGPYTLSRRGLVPYSERVVIEERDALRPDIVISTRPLARNIDYTFDFLANVLRLREPLFSHSTTRNPQFIVVNYELEDAKAGEVIGGRVEYRPSKAVTVGAALVTQSHDGSTTQVAGLDAKAQLAHNVTLLGEVGRSDGPKGSASAYRAEVKHHGVGGGETRAYYKEVGDGFGIGQLNKSATGNRQFGLEGTQRLSANVSTRELVYDETILGTGDNRRAAEAQLEWTHDQWTVRSGARAARDQLTSGRIDESVLATAGVSRRLFDNRLELRLDREQSLSGEAENLDFPTSTTLGAAYQLTAKTRLLAEQQWTQARGRSTDQTRIGLQSTPWSGGTLSSTVAQNRRASENTIVGNGLRQVLHVSPKLELEGGFEHSRVVAGQIATGNGGSTTPSPFHSAGGFTVLPQGDATSVFTGAHWKPNSILYNGRVEYRVDETTRRMLLLASAQAEPGKDFGVVTSVIAQHSESDTLADQLFLDARFGTAWRPTAGVWTMLNRLDLVRSPLSDQSDGNTWKAIENFHLNWRPGKANQFSAHLGAKFTAGHFDRLNRSTYTTLLAFEWRRRLRGPWDIGAQGGALTGWDATSHLYNYGISLGRTIGDAAWVSVGYNFDGYRDTDFTAARYSAPGFFLRFRLKFNQDSLGGLLRAIKEE